MPVSDLSVELDLSPAALAGIYRWRGWPLAMCKESTPTAEDLTELIAHVTREVAESDPGAYFSLGRILAIREPDMPNMIEVSLVIGVAWVGDGQDPDSPPANRFTDSPADGAHDILNDGETA
jgi:hypothetical protein